VRLHRHRQSRDAAAVSWRAWAAFAALCVIWGIPYFFIKLAVLELSPFVVAWGRITLGALILLPVAWHRQGLGAARGHWPYIAAFALAEFVVPFSAISYGEQFIESSIAGILMAAVPLSIALISRYFGVHERLSAVRVCGLMLGLIGVICLVGFGPISGRRGWIGVGCMVLATLGYAIGPLIIQKHLSRIESTGPAAGSLMIASVVLLWPAAATWPGQMPSATALYSIVLLGVLCTATAMLLMFYLVTHAGASRASVITYINPLVATALGMTRLHERIGWAGALAFCLILLGSWLATRGSATPAGAAAAAGNTVH
jgi:drug/metabolite transporter (DMT)-like permease